MVHRNGILGLVQRLRIWRTGISWNSTPRWGSRASSWASRSRSRSRAAPIAKLLCCEFRFFFALSQVGLFSHILLMRWTATRLKKVLDFARLFGFVYVIHPVSRPRCRLGDR